MTGKFKVWDEKLGSFLSGQFYFLDSDGKLHYLYSSTDKHHTIYSNECHDWITPIFSTGKTDKNGVELFDGDIFEYNNDIESGKAIIEMTDGSFIARWIKQKTSKPSIWTLMYYLGCSAELEKIGNKFENPELMETK